MWDTQHVEILFGRSDGRLLCVGRDGKLEKGVTCSTVLIIEQRQGTGCDRGPLVTNVSPFHLAIPVKDLDETLAFYEELLQCSRGRESVTGLI